MAGRIGLLGVYQLPVSDDLITAQADLLYGEASLSQRERVRRQLASTVLVEVLVSDADASFTVEDFVLENPHLARANWQAPWAVAFLTADGEQLLVDRWEPLPEGHPTFRVAFFVLGWQADQALLTSYGALPGAPPASMPDRLVRLVPYELID
jgi:hypothetical protein